MQEESRRQPARGCVRQAGAGRGSADPARPSGELRRSRAAAADGRGEPPAAAPGGWARPAGDKTLGIRGQGGPLQSPNSSGDHSARAPPPRRRSPLPASMGSPAPPPGFPKAECKKLGPDTPKLPQCARSGAPLSASPEPRSRRLAAAPAPRPLPSASHSTPLPAAAAASASFISTHRLPPFSSQLSFKSETRRSARSYPHHRLSRGRGRRSEGLRRHR